MINLSRPPWDLFEAYELGFEFRSGTMCAKERSGVIEDEPDQSTRVENSRGSGEAHDGECHNAKDCRQETQ
jgi:hypothetical protein